MTSTGCNEIFRTTRKKGWRLNDPDPHWVHPTRICTTYKELLRRFPRQEAECNAAVNSIEMSLTKIFC